MSRLASFILFFALLTQPLFADVHPNTAGGFPTDKAFTVGDLDSVNLFNGALTLTLPIGQSYPVNAGFSYRVQLVYNSSPWASEQINEWDPQLATFRDFTASRPNPCSNAGLGWRLSFGQINPFCQLPDSNQPDKTVYQDETGTDHVFYPNLHVTNSPEAPEPVDPSVFYTRDGSYLRLRVYPGPFTDPGIGKAWEVEFPDGTVREFNAYGRPIKIRDAFNNFLAIAYKTDTSPNPARPIWELTDSVGRRHKIVFRTDFFNQDYVHVVDYVELQTFGGERSKYQLAYSLQTIGRACPHDYTRGDLPGSSSLGVQVPILTSISQPDASSYSMSPSEYVTAVPPAVPDTDLSSPRCTDHAGNLLALHLPTGGAFQWSWQIYRFPTGSSTKKHAQRNSGVAIRSTYDLGGGLLGTWQYQRPEFPLATNEVVNTVIDPLGHRTERYFVTQLNSPNGNAPGDKYDYGLPFTGDVGNPSRQKTGSNGALLYLTSRVFENVAGQPSPVLRRSEYVRYERDETYSVFQPDLSNTNRRVVQSVTVFEDDPGKTAEVIQSDFDGLGHYRQQKEVNGGFLGAAGRTGVSTYNPARGTFFINIATNRQGAGHNFTMLTTSALWQLERMNSSRTEQQAVAGGAVESEMTEQCYAATAPVVVRQRTHRLDGSAQLNADLVVDRALNTAGNVTNEFFFGGDNQAVLLTGGVDLCTMALPATSQYRLNHTYSGGVRATTRYQGFNFYSLNQTIDASTGLPSASRDGSDLAINYTYDAFGRMLTARPEAGQGAWTQIAYAAQAGAIRANALVERRDNGLTGGAPIGREQMEFDGLGRVVREFHRLPSGSDAKRDTAYDGVGNRKSVTEWFLGSSAPGTTQFQTYDPFGRAGRIVPPDGAGHAVTLSFVGTRQVNRTVSIATTAGGPEAGSTTTETYDRFGRLMRVDEPSGSGSASVSTFYGYDVGSRLSSVSTTSGVTQNRAFTYDRAGLLQNETHPEKGAAGNGTVFYPKYDARGHLLRKQDGTSDLTYTFDKAERLTQVRESLGSQRVLKSFTYADANANYTDPLNGAICFDRKQGKLAEQSRFNYVTIFGAPYTVEMREGMTYCGRDGRLSRKALENRVNGSATPNESFYWPNWTYDSLGNVTTLSYPQCTHAACAAPSPRTIQNSYAVGGLTQVGFPGSTGAYASSITYHPNGMVNQVVHANTPSFPSTWLTDTYALDPFGMNRPASITTTTSGGVQRWATGAFGYDGAGNIKSMGTHTFGYDKVSRLTAANLYLEPTSSATLRFQTFSYDAFGNLQSIAGSSARSTPTSASTNRLAAPTTYDGQGNVTGWNGNQYEYDPFNLMWHYKTPTAPYEWVYLYNADDERVWSYKADNTSLWTLRDLGANVLREYTTNGTWAVQSDYVYREGLLLAAETSGGLRHFHLDHLGTSRLVTNSTGLQAAYHVYYPYGEEATAFNQDTIRAKFTGHERDLGNPGGSGDDLDYMHARFCSPLTGRFWGVDQGTEGVSPASPQTWNGYAYSLGNPVKYYDPDGHAINLVAAAGAAAIGTVFGGVGSIAAQLTSNGGNFRAINWRDVGAAAAGGGTSGGLAGITLGASLLAEAGAVTVIAVGAFSNTVGGAVTRKLDSSTATEPGDVKEMGIDFIAGGVGGAVGLKLENSINAKIPALQKQVASSRPAAQRGNYGASQSVKGHSAKIDSTRTTAEVASLVLGAKTTNVAVPVGRAVSEKKKKSNSPGN